MKYKNVFVTAFMLVFCFGLSVGFGLPSVFGNGNHSNHDNRSKIKVCGVVSSVLGSTISALNVDIDASAAEVKLMGCSTSLSVDDIVAGDIVEVKGTMNDGTFVASMIKLEGTGKLEGPVEAIGTDTVTLMGKAIDTTSAYCVKGKLKVGKKATVYVRNAETGLTALVVKAAGVGMMEME